VPTSTVAPAGGLRQARFDRVTHWLTALAFFALLVSGIEVLLSHPRFYWGETGNVNMAPLFSIPVPASRGTVPTGYGFVLPDQNGWSRYLHVQSAWLLIVTGLVYAWAGIRTGHFRTNLVPPRADRSWRALVASLTAHARFTTAAFGDGRSYNVVQRVSYLSVVFALVPLIIWTGLAMAPAFTAVAPWAATVLGGRQSARTLHFLITIALVLFTLVHLAMIGLAGFRSRIRAMITGSAEAHL
jgi:thiosulfate reductase cytochrome b subunit